MDWQRRGQALHLGTACGEEGLRTLHPKSSQRTPASTKSTALTSSNFSKVEEKFCYAEEQKQMVQLLLAVPIELQIPQSPFACLLVLHRRAVQVGEKEQGCAHKPWVPPGVFTGQLLHLTQPYLYLRKAFRSKLFLPYPQVPIQALLQSIGKSTQYFEVWLVRVQAGVLTSMRLGLDHGRSGRLGMRAEQCQHITCTRALRCAPMLPHLSSGNVSDRQPEVLL